MRSSFLRKWRIPFLSLSPCRERSQNRYELFRKLRSVEPKNACSCLTVLLTNSCKAMIRASPLGLKFKLLRITLSFRREDLVWSYMRSPEMARMLFYRRFQALLQPISRISKAVRNSTFSLFKNLVLGDFKRERSRKTLKEKLSKENFPKWSTIKWKEISEEWTVNWRPQCCFFARNFQFEKQNKKIDLKSFLQKPNRRVHFMLKSQLFVPAEVYLSSEFSSSNVQTFKSTLDSKVWRVQLNLHLATKFAVVESHGMVLQGGFVFSLNAQS